MKNILSIPVIILIYSIIFILFSVLLGFCERSFFEILSYFKDSNSIKNLLLLPAIFIFAGVVIASSNLFNLTFKLLDLIKKLCDSEKIFSIFSYVSIVVWSTLLLYGVWFSPTSFLLVKIIFTGLTIKMVMTLYTYFTLIRKQI